MGDGLLLEFQSIVDAVECAIAIQKLMAERNAETPEDKRIVYRAGVNLGDVLIEGDDILGEGVNIAARLEGVCEPGGVLISGSAYEHVRGKIDAEFVDLGDNDLKNIARPVRAYRVTLGGDAALTILSAPQSPASGSCAPSSRYSVDRGTAVRKHERRRRPAVFLRRPRRRHSDIVVEVGGFKGHCSQFQLRIQRAPGRCTRSRKTARRSICPGRKCP